MNRTLYHGALIVLALVMLGPVVTAAEDLHGSGEPLHSFSVAVMPAADLRVGERYTSVFGTGGGVTLAGMLPFPFFPPLSAGVHAAYHYVPVRTAETRHRFSLSLISTGLAVQLTWRVVARVELGLFGAATWSSASTGLNAMFVGSVAVHPVNAETLYASAAGRPYKSVDGGQNWIRMDSGMDEYAGTGQIVIDPVYPSTLYAAERHSIYKSTNGAASWTAIDTGLPAEPGVQTIVVDPVTTSILYAGPLHHDGGEGSVFKSTDAGGAWQSASTGLPDSPVLSLAIDPANTATLYAVTESGVYKSTNSALSWSAVGPGLPESWVGTLVIDPADTATLYVARWDGLFKSTNGGATWTSLTSDLEIGGHSGLEFRGALAIDPVNTGTLYAETAEMVIRSTDGGVSWVRVSQTMPAFVDRIVVHPADSAKVYAATQWRGVLLGQFR